VSPDATQARKRQKKNHYPFNTESSHANASSCIAMLKMCFSS
jgi:hypothetical protein